MKKWLKNNRETLTFIFVAFLAWRIWVQVFLWLGWFIMPLKQILLGGGMENFLAHPGLWAWANFDGEHYLAIAHHGYGNLEQAFFPFYPWLIKTLVSPFKESLFALLLSGLTISHLAFFIALFLLYLLVQLDFDRKVAQLTIIFLLVFPASFFFGSVYAESLFLALALGSFYAARKKHWWLAGILGAFASATRVVGIFLLPALLWEWWEQRKNQNSKIKTQNLIDLVFIFLIPLGLLFYMRQLAINYHDPLMFYRTHSAFGAGRSTDKLILLYQVFWRYFKMMVTTKIDPLYYSVWLEFLSAAGFLVLLVFSYLKKIRISYLIFAVFAYMAPTLTGTFLSMPLLVLVLFPCFISLALIKNKFFRLLLLAICCLLLAVTTIFFTRGYFVG